MDTAIQLITGPGGTLVLLLVILWSGWKRYWVFGWQFRETAAEKEEWKEAALRGIRTASRAVDHLEPTVKQREESDV